MLAREIPNLVYSSVVNQEDALWIVADRCAAQSSLVIPVLATLDLNFKITTIVPDDPIYPFVIYKGGEDVNPFSKQVPPYGKFVPLADSQLVFYLCLHAMS
ncbi:hypothetical protein D3C75_1075770 [compost metagenome]